VQLYTTPHTYISKNKCNYQPHSDTYKIFLTWCGEKFILKIVKYNSHIKDEARRLRINGASLNDIVVALTVPKTTLRGWITDISLSEENINKLKKRSALALQKGRKFAQAKEKKNRAHKEQKLLKHGKSEIGKLTKRELFIAGVALYWAEGFKNKHEHRLGFCNSDPQMVKFYISWLYMLGVKTSDLTPRLSLNISHIGREPLIKKFWSKTTNIPLAQFTKTFYQKSQLKKQYVNKNTYKGVLRIHVKESLSRLLTMKGCIEGLKSNCEYVV